MADAENAAPSQTVEHRVSALERSHVPREAFEDLESKVKAAAYWDGSFIKQLGDYGIRQDKHHREIQSMVFSATHRYIEIDQRLKRQADDLKMVVQVVGRLEKRQAAGEDLLKRIAKKLGA